MGYSIRTKRFRYTEWMNNSYRTNLPYDAKNVIGREMYDYEKDPLEKESVIGNPEYNNDQAKMEQLFRDCINREFKNCGEYAKLADFKKPVPTSDPAAKGKGKGKKKPVQK
jgi:hypothetical protein